MGYIEGIGDLLRKRTTDFYFFFHGRAFQMLEGPPANEHDRSLAPVEFIENEHRTYVPLAELIPMSDMEVIAWHVR